MTDLRPTVKNYGDLYKTENAAVLEKQEYKGLRRVMSFRERFPDDEVIGLNTTQLRGLRGLQS